MRVGLTGGIGVGKSAVGHLFEEFGALVIDTDRLAREVVAGGTEGLLEIADAWPQVVRDGVLDRAALAEIVFPDPVARARLDAIVHPRVRLLARAAEAAGKPGQTVVHVVPLLFETGYADLLDKSVLVVAPEAARIARVEARDGLDESQIRARMRAQIAPERARELADFVIENDAGLDELRARARAVYDRLARP